MNDPLRIDLALARAAGLPARSANDASSSLLPAASLLPTSPHALFSPLGLLLARFLTSDGAPAPVPTPAEARLLQDYLQQRVGAVLHAAGVVVPPALRVAVDAAGVLHLAPAPCPEDVVARLLQRDGDTTQLVDVLRRAALVLPEIDARALAATATSNAAPPRAPSIEAPDLRRAWWSWRATADSAGIQRNRTTVSPLLYPGVIAAALLALWLIS